MHAIAFAIIMGCNPIYVSGLDLDYNKGYANSDKDDWKVKAQGPNAWTPVRENLQNDIRVLSESAKKRGIEIINLNPDPWYDSFEVGELKWKLLFRPWLPKSCPFTGKKLELMYV